MTKVKIIYDGGGAISGIECDGHSGGKRCGDTDVVCVSVSVCMEVLEMGLRYVGCPADAPGCVDIKERQAAGVKHIHWSGCNDSSLFLANVVAEVLKNISASYPQNVSVEEEICPLSGEWAERAEEDKKL